MYNIIEQLVSAHFGVTVEEMMAGKSRNATDARHFLWYILHDALGYTISALVNRYGIGERTVLLYCAQVRDGLRHQPFYRKNYRAIQARLRMLDII